MCQSLVLLIVIFELIISHRNTAAMSPALVLPGREITLLEDGPELDWYMPQRHYFASIFQWAAENLIHVEDISNLANKNRLPVKIELTCFTGSFQVPGFETFDPDLIDTFTLLGDPAMQLFSTHYSFTSLI